MKQYKTILVGDGGYPLFRQDEFFYIPMQNPHILLHVGLMANDKGSTLRTLQLSSPELAKLMRTKSVFGKVFKHYGAADRKWAWIRNLRSPSSARAIEWLCENKPEDYTAECARMAFARAEFDIVNILLDKIDNSPFANQIMKSVIQTYNIDPRVITRIVDSLPNYDKAEAIKECILNSNLDILEQIMTRTEQPHKFIGVRELELAALNTDLLILETLSYYASFGLHYDYWNQVLYTAVTNGKIDAIPIISKRCSYDAIQRYAGYAYTNGDENMYRELTYQLLKLDSRYM